MKKSIYLVGALLLTALFALTSCEKKVEGDAAKVVGNWKMSEIRTDIGGEGQIFTVAQFKDFINQFELPQQIKTQLINMTDMQYTLNDNYKFTGYLPDTNGTFNNYSGEWSYSLGSAILVDKTAGLQWDFSLFEDGTMGKTTSTTMGDVQFVFAK